MDVLGWMTVNNTLVLILVVLAVTAVCLLIRQSAILATRLDRLHWRILTTRDSLELLLDERARYGERIADFPGFSEETSMQIQRAAHECARSEGVPLVADGLDRRSDSACASDGDSRARSLAYLDAQSTLSRVLRAVLDHEVRASMEEDPYWARELHQLDQVSYKVQLARSMHNLYVSQTHKIRERTWVRVAHLAGHAPQAASIDFDDDTLEDGHGY